MYNVRILDTCLPDYFQGYVDDTGKQCIAIPVDSETTPSEFYQAFMDEWNNSESDLNSYDNTDSAIRAFISCYTGNMDCTQLEFAEFIGSQHTEPYTESDSVYCYLALERD